MIGGKRSMPRTRVGIAAFVLMALAAVAALAAP
jgi:hypothetical protein